MGSTLNSYDPCCDPCGSGLSTTLNLEDLIDQQVGLVSALINITSAPYHADRLGISDSTSAIQSAINAGNGIYIPKGVYRISSALIINKSSFTIRGDGFGSSIAQYTPGQAGIKAIGTSSLSSWTMKDFQITTGPGAFTIGLDLSGVSSSYFENILIYSPGASGFATGIKLSRLAALCYYNIFQGLYVSTSSSSVTNAAYSITDGANRHRIIAGTTDAGRGIYIKDSDTIEVWGVEMHSAFGLYGIYNDCATGGLSFSSFMSCVFEYDGAPTACIFNRGSNVTALGNTYSSGFTTDIDFLMSDQFCLFQRRDGSLVSTRGDLTLGSGRIRLPSIVNVDPPSAGFAEVKVRTVSGVDQLVALFSTGNPQILAAASGTAVFGSDDAQSLAIARMPRRGVHTDGATTQMQGTTGINVGLLDFTISIDLQCPDYTNGFSPNFFYSHGGGGINNIAVRITTLGSITIEFANAAAAVTSYTFIPAPALVDGRVYRIDIACARSGLATLYINGVSDRDGSGALTANISGSSAINIGNGNANTWYAAGPQFIGNIFALRIFNRCLTAAQILILTSVDWTDQWGSMTVLSSGLLTLGKRYQIASRTDGDFVAAGAANNTVGTQFVATTIGTGLLDAGDTAYVIGAILDLDLTIGRGLFIPDRSTNYNPGFVLSSTLEHLIRESGGTYSVERIFLHSEISSSVATTSLLTLPKNCALIRFQFEFLTAFDAALTLDVGITGTQAKFVSAAVASATGLVFATSLSLGVEGAGGNTSIWVKKSGATTVGRVRIVAVVEIRGI